MEYLEILPEEIFSHHVESYWQLSIAPCSNDTPIELLLPTCTFNIILTNQPCAVKTMKSASWTPLQPGGVFLGQTNSSIYIKSEKPLKVSGIRFKPHAFANIIRMPVFLLNNELTKLDKLFEIDKLSSSLIRKIIKSKKSVVIFSLLNDLMYALFKNSLPVDEVIRAQINYILDRRGAVKIGELLEKFKVSKVTLRKHFINKVGLTPKKVSQIWRMNHMLLMKEEFPENNLTTLCLNAGFYDQAHFIKDFRLLFGLAPRKFFRQNDELIKVTHQSISKRFTNQYDPRVGVGSGW